MSENKQSEDSPVLVAAELHYKDPEAALIWLAKVFDFKTRIVVKDQQGNLVYSESGWDEHTVAVLPEMRDTNKSPLTIGGVNTQTVRIRSSVDVKKHCEKARGMGATIVSEPEIFFFGDLTYRVLDVEGHIWTFAQPVPGQAGRPPEGWTVSFPSRSRPE